MFFILKVTGFLTGLILAVLCLILTHEKHKCFTGTDYVFSNAVGKDEVNDTILRLRNFQCDLGTATFR